MTMQHWRTDSKMQQFMQPGLHLTPKWGSSSRRGLLSVFGEAEHADGSRAGSHVLPVATGARGLRCRAPRKGYGQKCQLTMQHWGLR
jgi:hypothetical protein